MIALRHVLQRLALDQPDHGQDHGDAESRAQGGIELAADHPGDGEGDERQRRLDHPAQRHRGTATAGSGRTPRRSGTRVRVVGRSRSGRGRQQLVTRVVQQPPPVVAADPAPDLDRPARVDPGDLPPAQPDQGHRARPVPQLDLQGRVAAAGVDRHRGDGPGQLTCCRSSQVRIGTAPSSRTCAAGPRTPARRSRRRSGGRPAAACSLWPSVHHSDSPASHRRSMGRPLSGLTRPRRRSRRPRRSPGRPAWSAAAGRRAPSPRRRAGPRPDGTRRAPRRPPATRGPPRPRPDRRRCRGAASAVPRPPTSGTAGSPARRRGW